MAISEVTIGSDIEWFLKDKITGEIVSAEGFIAGTKREPYRFTDNPWFATSLDNVLAEGNIPPCNDAVKFVNSILYLRNYINETTPNNLVTEAIGAARLDFKHLQTANAKMFGCDPAVNCWDLSPIAPQPNGDNLRSAGFHIHVGYKNPFDEQNRAIAKAMDLFLGVPAVLKEPPSERKKLGYGLAGNFRNQKHGCEYRVLSSWFSSTPDLIRWCYNQTMQAIKRINERSLKGLNAWSEDIQRAINTENKTQCKTALFHFDVEY